MTNFAVPTDDLFHLLRQMLAADVPIPVDLQAEGERRGLILSKLPRSRKFDPEVIFAGLANIYGPAEAFAMVSDTAAEVSIP